MAISDAPAQLTLPRSAAWLKPLIDRVAAIRASVHTKLRAGFLVGALLLVAMAVVSLAVQGEIAGRVRELNLAEQRLDDLRQMYYLVTAQSHYRTMSLLTHDDSYVQEIAQSKTDFQSLLDQLNQIAPPQDRGLLARITEANDRYATSGQRVLGLYRSGQYDEALQVHLGEEHPISHEIEGPISLLLQNAEQQMEGSQATVASDQALLTGLFVAFSIVSLITALLLGFILSWSLLLPLQAIHATLARIAGGRFDAHVAVPNRDEFGTLARNVNMTSQELATMYGQLETLNSELQGTNRDLVEQLKQRVVELDRSRGLITEAEERLRRELSEVLHSRVQNRLLTIWYRLEEIETLLHDPSAARREIAEVRDQLDDIREHDVRELSHRLHPSIIRAGLLPALEMLAGETPRVTVSIDAAAEVQDLDDAAQNGIPELIRLTAYRVVEEALGNVVKHAGAGQVQVRLAVVERGLELQVRDDGSGFVMDHVRAGLGMSSMAARVGRVGGTWHIDSVPGQGTTVRVVLPLSVEQMQDGLRAEAPFGQEGSADAARGHAVV